MLYDLRTTARGGASLRDIRESLTQGVAGGVFQTEVGTAGQIVILLPHAAEGAGQRARGGGEGGEPRLGVGPFGKHELEILRNAPFMQELQPGEFGRVYELCWWDYPPGALDGAVAAFEAAVPLRQALAPVLGCWTVEVGPRPDRIYALLAYRDWDHRDEVRATLQRQNTWPPRAPLPAIGGGSKLLLPAAFSPLR